MKPDIEAYFTDLGDLMRKQLKKWIDVRIKKKEKSTREFFSGARLSEDASQSTEIVQKIVRRDRDPNDSQTKGIREVRLIGTFSTSDVLA